VSAFFQTPQRVRRESEIKDINKVKSIRIGLSSSEDILAKSHGEVKNPETIDYKTHKPKFDGLFCERIFGPTKDYECNCGKFRGIKHKGVVCDRCGVEVIQSKVRRSRLGHIKLEMPVAHIWFSKGVPSRMAALIDMHTKVMEQVLYYEKYLVVEPGNSPYLGWRALHDLKPLEVLSEEEFHSAEEEYGPIDASMGAEAIRRVLENLDLESLCESLREIIRTSKSEQKRSKAVKRLKIAQDFLRSGNRPEWMILETLPVIPPDLRPLVPLDGGRFATSDLNDLYRRVINRNNRLRRLKEVHAPEVIIRNEKRMLQEAVDALLDNGRRGRPVKGSNNRPLKSLSDMLKGKGGRFRQNLLGKRVDYSGRSVIVCGPNLKFHECGLPKKMALELFEPFIIHHLEKLEYVNTIRSAKRMIEREHPVVYDVLERVIRDHPVLLNRAPTLHRLGIQAFMPKLVEGNAIQLHPLTCAAFNADFDGDQMAVHVPLSREAREEARALMLSSRNILKPSSGQPIATPSQDIVLGCYYLTKVDTTLTRGEPRKFASPEQAMQAFDHGLIKLQEEVNVRFTTYEEVEIIGEDQETGRPLARSLGIRMFIGEEPMPGCDLADPGDLQCERQLLLQKTEFIRTTVGRIYFNEILAPELRFVNQLMTSKNLSKLVTRSFNGIGLGRTSHMLDRVKDLGFQFAKYSGLSIALSDMVVPETKQAIIEKARSRVSEIQKQHESGATTEIERYNKVIDCWIKATEDIRQDMMQSLEKNQDGFNSLFMMKDSGARGSDAQIGQLSGIRGLMNKPMKKLTGGVGEIIESPIESNFKEGLTVLEYFISTHGARKGLADTALKTAEAGYLTRRLVDVAQDVIVIEDDCGTISGMEVASIKEGAQVIESLRDRILGRCALDTIRNPLLPDRVIIKAGRKLNKEDIEQIHRCGFENRYPINSLLVVDKSGKMTAPPEEINLRDIDWWEMEAPQELFDLLLGRTLLEDVKDTYNILVKAGDEITEAAAEDIERCGVDRVKIRSVLCCETPRGVCVKCYGRDLARGRMVQLGEASGVIAAQSIGEPGTQLTLRTFHIGGTTSRIVSESAYYANLKEGEIGAVRYINVDAEKKGNDLISVGRNGKLIVAFAGQRALIEGRIEINCEKTIEDRNGRLVVLMEGGELQITGRKKEVTQKVRLPYGVRLEQGLKNKSTVKAGDLLVTRTPWSRPLIATGQGVVQFSDVVNLGDSETFEGRQFGDRPTVRILNKKGGDIIEEFALTPRAKVLVKEGEKIEPGDFVAELPLPVISQHEGKVRYLGIAEGRTIQQRLDPVTGNLTSIVTQADEHNVPRIAIIGRKGEVVTTYHLPIGCEIRVKDGQDVFKGDLLAQSENLRQVEVIPVGANLQAKDGQTIENTGAKRPVLATWDPYQVPIIATQSGRVAFRDIELGVTVRQQREMPGRIPGAEGDEAAEQLIVMEQKEDKHPSIEILQGKSKGEAAIESLPSGALIVVKDGQEVTRGDTLAKIPRESFKSRDVTGGLPRVEEIFEARRPKPKDLAIIARVSGWVKIPRPGHQEDEQPILDKLGKKRKRGTRLMAIVDSEGHVLESYEVDIGKRLIRNDGEWVNVGDKLVDGSLDPHEYLEVMGEKRCMEYLLNEVQEVYRLQGVSINDKHLEIIIRQMMNKVSIIDPGDTDLLPEDVVDRFVVMAENRRATAAGGRPAKFQANLLGITKASLGTESFISAASFQETTRVLTAAAIAGKEDRLLGLKENVIMGHLIPAGTGKAAFRALRISDADRESVRRTESEILPTPPDLEEALDQGVIDLNEIESMEEMEIAEDLGDGE
jgi:DNA-directed RNA polymerase beta' subunit